MPIKVKTTQSADSQEAPREMIGITHLTVRLGSQTYKTSYLMAVLMTLWMGWRIYKKSIRIK